MGSFTESTVEQAALAWLESVGWPVRHGAEIAPGELAAERERLRTGRPGAAAARCARAAQPRSARRGAGRRLPQAHAARGRGAVDAQPRGASPAGGRRDGRVPHARRRDPRRPGAGDRLRRTRTPTTGWRSTSSPWPRTSTAAGRTSCCSSTACRWRSWSSRTRRTRTPRSGRPSSSSRPTRPRSRRSSPRTRCWSSPTGWRRASARSPPGASGSSPGAPSRASAWPIRICRSCRW